MITGLKKAFDETFDMLDKANPFVTALNAKSIEMAEMLLDAGFTAEDIKAFVDLSTAEFYPWLDQEVAVRTQVNARIKKMEKKEAYRTQAKA